MTDFKVLIVEDAKLWRIALADHLTEAGHTVQSCDDGMTAIEYLKNEPFDAVIMDYLLPRIDGGRICAFIRHNPELSRVVTIILTGAVVGGLPRESLADADAVVAKGPLPFTLKTCSEVLNDLLVNNTYEKYKTSIIEPIDLYPREMTLKVIKLKEYIDTLQSKLTDAIFEIDDRQKIVYINPAAAALIGKPESVILGMNLSEILSIPDDSPLAIALDKAISSTEELDPGPFEHKCSDRYLESSVSRIPYVFGKIGAILISRNTTDRVNAQRALQDTEDKLRQSQKLEAVGRLAGGVAHDFSNLLTVISGHAEILSFDLHSNDFLSGSVKEIQNAVKRGVDLIRSLLTFARRQVMEPEVLNINTVISNMENMLRRLIEADIELIIRYGSDIGFTKIDPQQLEQLIINLVVNARDAMPHGGKLTITTFFTTLEETTDQETQTSTHFVVLTVSDTGFGMSEEILPQIFEPFFTTKEEGKGTGLGLATVYGIVQDCAGDITVTSEMSKGSTFTVYLPQCEDEPSSKEADGDQVTVDRGWETVLVVEDDVKVQEIICYFLKKHGYKTLEAQNGKEALALMKENAEKISLVITDVVMPVMNGIELSHHIRSIHPNLPFLFFSGYTDQDIKQRGVLSPETPIMTKPIKSTELIQIVREILDSH